MTNTNGAQSAVLLAYASANKRAEQALESVREQFQPALDAAIAALQTAKTTDLIALRTTLDRAYVKACQKFEIGYRQASNKHGQAMTQVLSELDLRRKEIVVERDESLHEVREHYQHVCHAVGFFDHPACLPAYDALMAREELADQVRDQKLAESHALYLEDKARLDVELAEQIVAMTSEKSEACAQATNDHEIAVAALIPPLEATVVDAQTALNLAVSDATTIHHRLRDLRMDILGAFENRSVTEAQAIRALDLLWAESPINSQ